MSNRDGVVIRVDVPCEGGVSPNRKIPLVSVEIRGFWPDPATDQEVSAALLQAVGKFAVAYAAERGRPL